MIKLPGYGTIFDRLIYFEHISVIFHCQDHCFKTMVTVENCVTRVMGYKGQGHHDHDKAKI